MAALEDKIADLMDQLDEFDEKVTVEPDDFRSRGRNRSDGRRDDDSDDDDHDDDEEELRLLVFALGSCWLMTWIFFCCFCCILRKRSTVDRN